MPVSDLPIDLKWEDEPYDILAFDCPLRISWNVLFMDVIPAMPFLTGQRICVLNGFDLN